MATTVLQGEITEETERLRVQLEQERNARRRVEMDLSQVQDELHRLTTPPTSPQPAPAPAKAPRDRVTSRMFSFGREESEE